MPQTITTGYKALLAAAEKEIETLSVAPEARGTGIGAHLIGLARDEVEQHGYEGLSLVAVAANRDALRFYEREGFAPTFVILRDSRRRR